MRTFVATFALLLLTGGCAGTDPPVATDRTPTSAPSTAAPTVGSYPHFTTQDYRFTLRTRCFCPDTGPVQVTVSDGEVVSVTHLGGGGDNGLPQTEPGSVTDQSRALTIEEVIDAANDTTAARVVVDWPAGQDYPSRVSVDQDELIADEEVTYLLSDVLIAPG